jgi:hypothetical protein
MPDIRETLPYTSIERKVLSVWALAQETSAEQTTITSTQAYVILGLVVVGILAAGLVVIYGRSEVPGDSTSTPATASSAPPSTRTEPTSIIRSWIAIALVIGLLIFCGAAFLVSDTTLRSTLMGGLVASVGAAVAFTSRRRPPTKHGLTSWERLSPSRRAPLSRRHSRRLRRRRLGPKANHIDMNSSPMDSPHRLIK